MRGTLEATAGFAITQRFIPAYAGNTPTSRPADSRAAVHPRVCGEHFEGVEQGVESVGSSPRMRGTRSIGDADERAFRFIPAYAGNTATDMASGRSKSVHPRVCGEHPAAHRIRKAKPGSSPRMRGTQECLDNNLATERFIPAYAGNTVGIVIRHGCVPVHPRVCGEHFLLVAEMFVFDGSSPRMRGTHKERNNGTRSSRFIPAYAGNTP